MSRKILPGLVAASLLAGATAASATTPVARDYVFNWVGNCEDCAQKAGTDTFEVRARLTLPNYIAGTPFNRTEDFLFEYSGSNIIPDFSVSPFTVPPELGEGFYGGAQNSVSGSIDQDGQFFDIKVFTWTATTVSQTVAGNRFTTSLDGRFLIYYYYSQYPDDLGTGVWNPATTAVPEPNSWALLLLGFGTLGTVMRRRRTVAA